MLTTLGIYRVLSMLDESTDYLELMEGFFQVIEMICYSSK